MQDECYNIIFRKKIYSTLEELQLDIGCILTIELDLILVSIAMPMRMHITYQKLKAGVSIDVIAEITDLSVDEIKKLKD